MANETTNIREAERKLEVEGIISEMTLEATTDANGKEIIKGDITIQTSEVNFIKVGAYAGKYTAAGAASKVYTGLETVMRDYKSIAKDGKEEATKVRVTNGTITPNTYFNDAGRHDSIRYNSNFFNRVKENDEFEPKALFDVEVFIQAILEEMNSEGETTGRAIVKGWAPLYNNGIEPFELIAPVEVADAIMSTFEPGQTVSFSGDIVNNVITETIEIPVAIGKPKTKVKKTYVNEMIITGATEAYEEGVTINPPYEAEVIKKAVEEREITLKSKEAKAKAGKGANGGAAPSAAGTGKAAPSNRAMPW